MLDTLHVEIDYPAWAAGSESARRAIGSIKPALLTRMWRPGRALADVRLAQAITDTKAEHREALSTALAKTLKR
jgi:hypothetical protein